MENIDVQESFYRRLERIKFAIKESIFMNLFSAFISVGKVSVVAILLIINNEKCYGSLRTWLIAMLSFDAVYFLATVIVICEIACANNRLQETLDTSVDNSFRNFDLSFHSQVRRRFGNENSLNGFDVNNNIERHNPCTNYLLEFSRFCYLLLFLFGNVIFFTETLCTRGLFPFFLILISSFVKF